MEKYKSRIIKIAAGILVIFFVLVAAFCCIRYSGKKNLENDITNTTHMGSAEGAEIVNKNINHVEKKLEYQGKTYQYRENIVNILCIGVDKEERMSERDDDGGSVGQSDAILLVSLDFENNKIRVLAVPRDTMVNIIAYDAKGNSLGSFEGQIALQYAYADGQELSCSLVTDQVSSIFNRQVPINAYAAFNLSCIGVVNDAVGGVTVTMDEDYTLMNPAFEKGAVVHLEGEEAQQYVQGRDITVAGSACTRIDRQKQYLKAFVQQAKTALGKDMTLPVTLMQELSDYMLTDITADEAVYLATELLNCSFSEEDMQILPGEIRMGEIYEEYHLDKAAIQEEILELFYEAI